MRCLAVCENEEVNLFLLTIQVVVSHSLVVPVWRRYCNLLMRKDTVIKGISRFEKVVGSNVFVRRNSGS